MFSSETTIYEYNVAPEYLSNSNENFYFIFTLISYQGSFLDISKNQIYLIFF